MKKTIIHFLSIFLLAISSIFFLSWGTWGHQHINHAAVFALPEEMRHFFYNHIDYITEESTVPDIRRSVINDKAEPGRHYINIETYQPNGGTDSLPLTMAGATAKYDAKLLDKGGILPWYIIDITQKLTNAMQARRKTEILFLAADLGHYLGDATQPLHNTINYDGQLTDQKGIHSFFESQLPEAFGNNYNFYTGDAVYIKDIQAETWRIIINSRKLADTLLLTEKKLKAGFDTSMLFQKDAAGNIIRNRYNSPVHSNEYVKAFHDALNGMVEKQIRVAVASAASFWYTAWVNAGKPNLDDLDEPSLTSRNRKNYKKDYKAWQKGRLFGFKIEKEF